MATDPDPYRTLGLSRDATLDEVRRAYRRLAKANHPDAAGEAALPRFLAIQAAYDTIAGPDARTRRPGATRAPGPRRAWDAERERTEATYRAYGGRSRRSRPSGGAGPGPRPGADRPPGTSRPPRPERPPNKATLGSTSYDGADAEPFEPDWVGASWYGTTSGTYWTLNPKEYADPRKHGPEYQARARRKLNGRADPEGEDAAAPEAPRPVEPVPPGAPPTGAPRPGAAAEAAAADDRPTARSTPPPSHTTSSWWEATAGHPPRTARRDAGQDAAQQAARPARPDRPSRPTRPTRAGSTGSTGDAGPAAVSTIGGEALLGAVRAWLDDTHPGTVGRVARAVVGWAPLALGIGWLSGEISGCGRFAAGCDDAAAMTAWIAQIAVLVPLLLVGRLARIASAATLATLAAAVPAALLLSATGNPDDAVAGRIALSGLLVIAWVVGVVFATVREIRGVARGPSPPGVSGPARPVS